MLLRGAIALGIIFVCMLVPISVWAPTTAVKEKSPISEESLPAYVEEIKILALEAINNKSIVDSLLQISDSNLTKINNLREKYTSISDTFVLWGKDFDSLLNVVSKSKKDNAHDWSSVVIAKSVESVPPRGDIADLAIALIASLTGIIAVWSLMGYSLLVPQGGEQFHYLESFLIGGITSYGIFRRISRLFICIILFAINYTVVMYYGVIESMGASSYILYYTSILFSLTNFVIFLMWGMNYWVFVKGLYADILS